MVKSISGENRSDKVFAFLLGLSVSENITSVFSFGSTSFTLSEVLSPILLIFLCLKDINRVASFMRCVPIGFKLFFAAVIVTIIPGLIYFMSVEIIYRYCVGLIYLVIVLTAAIDAFILRKSKDTIIKGIFVGLVGNMLYTILCFVAFHNGILVTLKYVIPHAGFYAPSASFRSQGFFLEPSHFIRYVGTVGLIVIASTEIRHSFFKYVLILISAIALIFSYSGSLVILATGYMMYWIGSRGTINIRRARPGTLVPIFVVLLIAIVAIGGFNINKHYDVEGVFDRIMNGADITDKGNAERFESMQKILENPSLPILLGCGWNLTGTYIQTQNLGITAAFSDILELLLETGIVGLALYVGSLLSMSFTLWKMRGRYSRALSVSLLVIFALQIGTDYALNTCIMLVFGLSVGELADSRLVYGSMRSEGKL